jgi:hypothetical protein
MANDIGWGSAYDVESGWGMSVITGAELGYGSIVIDSYAGDTFIAGPGDSDKSSLFAELPLLYIDSLMLNPTAYVYFLLAEGVTASSMSMKIYYNGDLYADNALATDGINFAFEFPEPGDYYAEVTVNVDSEIFEVATSNILTV